ncbi:MAG: exodeoxyribonuclease III [Gloeomargarita sp. SKYB31]|nr:exodeoxyribonuclease III [Gloeomargarita sp. SKYB31]
MQIATWNVNSIRTRLGHIQTWLQKHPVEILCLQETKVTDDQFPTEAFPGYHCVVAGQKSYNGVAILTRIPPTHVSVGFVPLLGQEWTGHLDEQKRLIHVQIQGLEIVNVYVPNGQSVGSDKYDYKLRWLAALHQYLQRLLQQTSQVCVCGDWNVAPTDLDIYDPQDKQAHIMASPSERAAFQQVLALDFQDSFRLFCHEGGHFTWWDYRAGAFRRNQGWRIDHILISQPLRSWAKHCWIDREPRAWPQPSDHVPVVLELDWPPTR